MRIPLLALLLLSALPNLSCESTKTNSLELSLQEYNKGQWMLSEMWAKKAIENNTNRNEAQYMLGLCEFQLEDIDSSKDWFIQAQQSNNPDVKGKATAMLGIIATSEGDYESAQLAFKSAVKNLNGIDKQKANARSGNPILDGKFTLQFGAYQNRSNADKAVVNLTNSLSKSGLGTVWITPESGKYGKTMFLVQAGHFPTRSSASRRRGRGDLPQCIVAASN
jgi:tetratricopeptide (TPR) repeat protein